MKNTYNKEEKKEKNRKYYLKNREKLLKYREKRRQTNLAEVKEIGKQSCLKNKEKHKKKALEYFKQYAKNRRSIDPLYKLTWNIRSLVNSSFRKRFTKKAKKTSEILGCSFEEFKIHLEKQFDENMTWENQGSYWHLDHIKPISLAKNEQEVYELNHYTNLQPMEKLLNLRKFNHYPWLR